MSPEAERMLTEAWRDTDPAAVRKRLPAPPLAETLAKERRGLEYRIERQANKNQKSN